MDIVREEELSSFRTFQFAGNCNKSFDRNLGTFNAKRFVVGLCIRIASLRVFCMGILRPRSSTRREALFMAKAGNKCLETAEKQKKDEFYTQLSDIERELRHYVHHFKGKTILCNCDDPRISNFFHYFSYKFEDLGLKRLITTCCKNQDRGDDRDGMQANIAARYCTFTDICFHFVELILIGRKCVKQMFHVSVIHVNPP